MAKKFWARIFSRLVGKLITGQEDDAEFDNVYTALNDIEERKLERDGTQDMTGNLIINLAKAGIHLKNAPNQISRVISDANGINLTFNAYIDTDGSWKRDDTSQKAERLYITTGYVYHYSAPAGANPITWNLDWQINNDGTATIMGRGGLEVFGEYYNNTLRQITPSPWSGNPIWITLHTINLTVPEGKMFVGIIEGSVCSAVPDNATGPRYYQMRIRRGTSDIFVQRQTILGNYGASGPLSGQRLQQLGGPYTYTFTLDFCGSCPSEEQILVAYSQFGIIGSLQNA